MNNYGGYYRPRVPFVVKNLIIINAIVFVVTMLAQKFMYETFSLFYFTSPFFKPFQLITYMFMHGGFWHIFFNMFSLYMFGSVIESYWGGKKFFLYYMICGIGAGLINELVMYLQIAFAETPGLVEAAINRVPTVGASGAINGLLLAYGMKKLGGGSWAEARRACGITENFRLPKAKRRPSRVRVRKCCQPSLFD